MTTIEARHASPAKPPKPAKGEKSKSAGLPSSAHTTLGDARDAARVTKHDRVLSLLSRKGGATLPEMMDATGWQQHSVRGFLAGTVKKKLGFSLTSSKAEGELRRYRIEMRRGR